jgi:hypothetical protein
LKDGAGACSWASTSAVLQKIAKANPTERIRLLICLSSFEIDVIISPNNRWQVSCLAAGLR